MMYSNNLLNFQKSTIHLNAQMKKVWKLIVYIYIYIYIYIYCYKPAFSGTAITGM